MAQSTWIALALVALYLVYVTARGELGAYLATILGPYPAPETGTTAGTGTAGAASGMAGTLQRGLDVISPAPALGRTIGNLFGSGAGSGNGVDYSGGKD